MLASTPRVLFVAPVEDLAGEDRTHRLKSVELDAGHIESRGVVFVLTGICGVEQVSSTLPILPSPETLCAPECPDCFRREP